ncbi:MAG TPA: hypothetical protein VMZ31_00590 [Phycisphaerae bacterium]|nr:hypothetical protein [Phycisphaerae bacterium]
MDRNPIRDTLTDEDLIRMVRDADADAFDVPLAALSDAHAGDI